MFSSSFPKRKTKKSTFEVHLFKEGDTVEQVAECLHSIVCDGRSSPCTHNRESNSDFRRRIKRRIKLFGGLIVIVFVTWCLPRKSGVLHHPRHYGNNRTATPHDLQGAMMSLIGFSDLLATEVENYVKSGEIIEDFEFPLSSRVCDNNVHLIVVVFSKPSNLNERRAIRRTWGSQFRFAANLKLVFLLGQADQDTTESILHEHKLHSDIVQSSFTDSYTNLVLKTIAMLQWTRQFCSQANFLLKIDDDMFLYRNTLLSILESVKDEQHFIIGNINSHSTPFRSQGDIFKYDLSYKTYPFSRFPPYADGPSYVVSSDLVARLHEIAKHKPQMHLEDVYVTGLCAFVAQAHHIGNCGFALPYSSYFFRLYINICTPVTVHGLSTEQIHTFWENLH